MMYKISFKLKSPVCFTDRPTFDGILAWCYMKERAKEFSFTQELSIENVDDFSQLPIEKHADGYFMASWMLFEEADDVEFVDSWKKRWANQHDFLVDFKGKVKKVRINAGAHKSYDMPMVLHNINKVWFYFATNDVASVKKLIEKHLWGIGKKTSQGKGEIESFEIEKISENPFDSIIRPVPAKSEQIGAGKTTVRMMGWKPPYWLPENQAFCLIP